MKFQQFHFMGIDWSWEKGKAGRLDGGQIAPDGPGVAVFFCGKFSHSDALFPGLNGPQNTPLPS